MANEPYRTGGGRTTQGGSGYPAAQQPPKKKKKTTPQPYNTSGGVTTQGGSGYPAIVQAPDPFLASAPGAVAEVVPPLGSVIPPMDFSIGGPGYQPGAGFPRQMQGQAPFPTIASDQGGGGGGAGGGSWFDMFTSAPQLTAQTPQIPQVGGGQAQVQPAPTDPLSAFMMGQMGQQQPVIPPFDAAGLVKALRYDPVSEHSRLASLPSYAPESQSPFATGYFKQPSSAGLSPEAVLASQGNTATNQWAQMGGVPSMDPELLRRLNAGVAGRRLY